MRNIILVSTLATSLISGASITHSQLNKDVNLVIHGEKLEVSTYKSNVEELLKEQGIEVDAEDILTLPLDSPLRSGQKVEIIDVETENVREFKDVAFETEIIKDDEILEGEVVVVSEGEVGETELRFVETYHNGELVSKQFSEELLVKQPVARVIVEGTKVEEIIEEEILVVAEEVEVKEEVKAEEVKEEVKVEEPKEEVKEEVKVEEPKVEEVKKEEVKVEEPKVEVAPPVVEEPKVEEPKVEVAPPVVEEPKVEEPKVEEPKVEVVPPVVEEPKVEEPQVEDVVDSKGTHLVVNSTAYTATGNLTATGTVPKWGTIAVDPSVIPFGTKVYIPQFDKVFIAEDSGGAIKGNKIDIFMNSNSEAINWGRRNIDVYVMN